jgi:predicted TPR repeat methyltransferase
MAYPETMPEPLFMTSGDLIADRRVELARQYQAAGDGAAAADLFAQAVERAPQFAWAWFMLGEVRRELGDRAGAIEAFAAARAHDPADRLGAGLQLARLRAADPAAAMSDGYVRALFDQYAPRFEAALAGLDYRAPQLLRDAVVATGSMHFDRALDLGCGTGLAAQAFAQHVGTMHGVDLSPKMIAQAERTGLYGALTVDDMLAFLQRQGDASADLVIAADALVYLADLAPLMCEAGRVLAPRGLFAFTVETHAADGVILGEKLRYAHGAGHVHAALAQAGLAAMTFAGVSTRNEAGAPVPGLLVVAR